MAKFKGNGNLADHQRTGAMNMEEIEPELSDDGAKSVAPTAAVKSKGRRSLSRVTLELTESELKNSAVQKLLVDDLNRQIEENENLRGVQQQFHAADKRAEVLAEKLTKSIGLDIMHSGLLTVGAALAGYGATAGRDNLADPMLVGLGVILILAALIARSLIR